MKINDRNEIGREQRPIYDKEACGLYIHIPFCVRKCLYCDFLSFPAGEDTKAQYVEQLCRELSSVIRRMEAAEQRIATVYFGGGTPSLLTGEQIRMLMGLLSRSGLLASDCEVTMEVNPGTVDMEKLSLMYRVGVNRLSMGVQSFQAEELSLLGRIHSANQAKEAFAMAREAGFTNLSMDLMSGLPGQTKESFLANLQEMISLKPEHVSAYSLILEPGTPLYDTYGEHFSEEVEDLDRELYSLTEQVLGAAGYERYEISNYAKPGYSSRHNSSYWTGIPYYGCGLGASSLLKVGEEDWYRTRNRTDIAAYLSVDYPGSSSGDDFKNSYEEVEALSRRERMEEFMFLGLRLTAGISKQKFFSRFHVEMEEVYGSVLSEFVADGLISNEGDRVKLTEKGLDLSNYCFTGFLLEEGAVI